jgi:DNA-binding CsgD family transcriptional regulator
MTQDDNKWRIIISFSILFGWVMSLPYEGPVLFALADMKGINGDLVNTVTVFSHFAGLFLSQFFVKDVKRAKQVGQLGLGAVLLSSMLLPFTHSREWFLIIPFDAFLAGVVITAFAYLIFKGIPHDERRPIAAMLLIFGNLELILAHILANNIGAMPAFAVITLLLGYGWFQFSRIDIRDMEKSAVKKRLTLVEPESCHPFVPMRQYWIFFLFIFIITINSGIMFSVIYPYFESFPLLTSLYTNVPYIGAIYVLSKLVKTNKFQYLYIGLAMWGVTFILFALTGQTAVAFVVICTIMLAACGIFDLFWWHTMITNFDSVENPAGLFGTGLAINVFGVWSGSLLGMHLMSMGVDKMTLSLVGIGIVFLCLVIVYPLNRRLSEFLENNEFVFVNALKDPEKAEDKIDEVKAVLTRREFEVFELLVSGMTDAEISKSLYISPHTTKSHNRNIYKKLEVANRIELYEKYI